MSLPQGEFVMSFELSELISGSQKILMSFESASQEQLILIKIKKA